MKLKKYISLFAAMLISLSCAGVSYAENIENISALTGENMNLGEFSKFCVDYYNLYDIKPAQNYFKDLKDDDPNKDSILRLAARGYILGNGDATVSPYEIVSKSRAYTIITRINEDLEAQKTSTMSKAPNVTDDMCTSEYWRKSGKLSSKVIMTLDEIEDFNKKVMATKETYMNDPTSLSSTYNGVKMAENTADYTPDGLYLNGEPVSDEYYEAIKENILSAEVSEKMEVEYGFVVTRTLMRSLPYDDFLSDDPNDLEWDECMLTSLLVNEPIAAYIKTADGKFTYVKNDVCSGWVKTEDIALCATKEEWLEAQNMEKFVVVTGEKIYLEASADKDMSEKMLSMGTILALDEDQTTKTFNDKETWNNYVVKLPVRLEDGSLGYKRALIPANRDVNIGYLPYTEMNVIDEAFKSLGNRYGWGGMLDALDCSGFAKDVYRCFGFKFPRNTTWQGAMPEVVKDISKKTDKEKMKILDNTPAGSILQFPGHEMIYIGRVGDKYYTINDVNSLVDPENVQNGVIKPNGVVVNDLSVQRRNGTTWLNNLSKIITIK